MKNDLINGRTPEQIIEANRHCSRCFCDECAYSNAIECQTDLKRDCVTLIKHLEAQQPKWISVKDRLPEAEGMYIVYIPLTGETIIAADYLDGHWIDWEVDLTEHVTHWMPLPEPPKEAEHAD